MRRRSWFSLIVSADRRIGAELVEQVQPRQRQRQQPGKRWQKSQDGRSVDRLLLCALSISLSLSFQFPFCASLGSPQAAGDRLGRMSRFGSGGSSWSAGWLEIRGHFRWRTHTLCTLACTHVQPAAWPAWAEPSPARRPISLERAAPPPRPKLISGTLFGTCERAPIDRPTKLGARALSLAN